jgi:MFS family permease
LPRSSAAVPDWSWRYRIFALVVLTAANVLNYADRSLLSALALPIKHDLAISDAQLGFLAGTSFVVFNALVGVAMARLGDSGRRNLLLLFGVGLWSLMTALSGFASSYAQLVAARIGVGVGEATVGAIGYSMLADIFPSHRRALVFSLFICAPFLGLALSLAAGGWVVDNWPAHCAALGACGVKGWQAAFLLFGSPGIVVAVLAGALREPRARSAGDRGQTGHPVLAGLREISFVVPPFALLQAWRVGGRKGAAWNLGLAAICAALFWLLYRLTGNLAQWAAVTTAAYGFVSWARAQATLSPELYRLTVGSRAFQLALLGAALIGSVYGTMSFWSVPLAAREYGLSIGQAGAMLGAALGGGSLAGTLVGGAVADRWRRRTAAAPLYICMICVAGGGLLLAAVLAAPNARMMGVSLGLLMVFLGSWPAGFSALVQDLVTPAMRTRAAAIYITVTTLVGGSLGPYTVGRLGDATGSLRIGLACLFLLLPCALVLLLAAVRALPGAFRLRDVIASGESRSQPYAVPPLAAAASSIPDI